MRRLYESPCELGALTVTGKDVFNAILKDESVTYNDCIGDSEWYDRSSLVNNLSFEVVSEGENGSIIFIQLYDINQTGNTDLFYKLNTALFDGDEEEAVNTWLKSNLGKESTITIRNMRLSLRLSINNYPLLDIVNSNYPECF